MVWAVKHVYKNEAKFVVADVTHLASLTQAGQRLESRLGPVGILTDVAGVT